jgi:hypothetical protein
MDQRVWDNHIISTDEIAPEWVSLKERQYKVNLKTHHVREVMFHNNHKKTNNFYALV